MMENNYSVYIHITPCKKRYVGLTSKKPEKRWGANGNQYKKQVFYNAIQKYGWDNIEHIIVKTNLTKEEAENLEQDLIKKYNSNNRKYGYNLSIGGESGSKGATFSFETRQKMSNSHKGLKPSKESIQKRIEARKDYVCSEKTKNKMSLAMKKRWHNGEIVISDETRKKIGLAQMGEKNHRYGKRYTDDEKQFLSTCHKRIRICAFNEYEELYFNSLTEAVNSLGVKCSNLTNALKNQKRWLGGYHWKKIFTYKGTYPDNYIIIERFDETK